MDLEEKKDSLAMDFEEEKKDSSVAISLPKKNLNIRPAILNGPSSDHPWGAWFEIRLFYVRIAPCVTNNLPDFLTIRHFRHEIGVSMEINGSRIPASDTATLTLRRDRVDRESSEVTYVSTDSLRLTGAIEFEVYEKEDMMILCGNLERIDSSWGSNGVDNHHDRGLDKDSKTGWSMDCYTAVGVNGSAFFQPKLGVSSPSIEVYVAGCCSGFPLILTKTIQISPRRKHLRHAVLDAIPEDEETGKDCGGNNFTFRRKLQVTRETDTESEDYDPDGKMNPAFYSGDMYTDEGGQLSWFNAGVRVGVGIGLGMCLGIGIGVGLLMRSYQVTTRTFRRSFS